MHTQTCAQQATCLAVESGEEAYRIFKQVVTIILGSKHKCVQAIC